LQAGSSCGIIIYRNNITAIAKKLLQPGAIPGVKLEVFKVRGAVRYEMGLESVQIYVGVLLLRECAETRSM